MVEKETLANAQAELNRKWERGHRMVESGILGHWDGTEEVEKIG